MAVTNFFSQLAALDFTGCLNLSLHRDGESLTVSVLTASSLRRTPHANIPELSVRRLTAAISNCLQTVPG